MALAYDDCKCKIQFHGLYRIIGDSNIKEICLSSPTNTISMFLS